MSNYSTMSLKPDWFIAEIQDLVSARLLRLNEIWEFLGLSDDQVMERGSRVHALLEDLMLNMVEEEESLKTKVQDNLARFSSEIQSMKEQLGTTEDPTHDKTLEVSSCSSAVEMQPGSLCLKERKARKEVVKLKELITERRRTLNKLASEEVLLCKRLGEPSLLDDGVDCDSADQDLSLAKIQVWKRRVEDLTKEYDRRTATFTKVRNEVLAKLEEYDLPVVNLAVTSLLNSPSSVVSNANIESLQNFSDSVESLHRASVAKRLRSEISRLWLKLGVTLDYADKFKRKYFSPTEEVTSQVSEALSAEKTRLIGLRQSNMETLINNANRKLQNLRTEAMLVDLNPTIEDEFIAAIKHKENEKELEAVLDKLEKDIDHVNDELDQRKPVLNKLEIWKKSHDRILELDIKHQDPNRLKNRGGTLLAEEKERKKIRQQLPKLQKAVFDAATLWVKTNPQHEADFFVNGQSLADYFENSWKKTGELKEVLQEKRQQKIKKNIETEMRYGCSNPNKKKLSGGSAKNAKPSGKKADSSVLSDSGVYLTSWGQMRSSPIKSVVGKYATAPTRGKAKAGKQVAPKTTDSLEIAKRSAAANFKERKLRRRSKSTSNLLSLWRDEDKQEEKKRKRLPLPSMATSAKRFAFSSAPLANSTRVIPVLQLPTQDELPTFDVGNCSYMTTGSFSETIQDFPRENEAIEDEKVPDRSGFEKALVGVFQNKPYCRSSAVGVNIRAGNISFRK